MHINITDKKFIALFLVLLAFVYFHFFMNRAHVQLSIAASEKTNLKIYWAGKGQVFHENRSEIAQVYKRKHEYGLYLDNLKDIEKLRIDPVEMPAVVTIKSIIITQKGYKPIRFETRDEMNRLIPAHDISYSYTKDHELFLISSGNDPQLEVHLSPERTNYDYLPEAIRLIVVATLLTILLGYFKDMFDELNYVPLLMMFITALIIVMAGLSKNNRHPDEYVHVNAAVYYENHWRPPEICAPGTEKTYSAYGFSRLNSHEIIYFIAGKFSSIFRVLSIGKYDRLRLFNLFLFIVLLVMNFRVAEFRLIALPLLISPQIWYVFSYFNSDAFSIFILFIVSYQILIEKSMLRRCLRCEYDWKGIIVTCILIGLLLAILLLLKKNYYIFILYLGIFYIIAHFTGTHVLNKITVKYIAVIVIVGLSLFSFRHASSIYINGFNKKEKIIACREKLADYEYKPSTLKEKQAPHLNLRSRGVTIKEMFVKMKYHERLFKTAFGTYGYTSVYASNSYYRFIKTASVLFFFFIGISILIRGDMAGKLMLGNVIFCSLVLMAGSLWASWTIDFQGQGRYLLPITAMLGMLLYRSRDCFNKRILNGFIITLFCTSVYSFIFIGFRYIPKS